MGEQQVASGSGSLLSNLPSYDPGEWVSFLVVGVLAAFLVGYLMRRRGFGLIGNIVVGVVGAMLGALLLGFVPEQYDYLAQLPQVDLGDLAKAMIGAFVFLLIASALRKRK